MAVEPAASDWIRPHWRQAGVTALMSTREGGVSASPFDRLNLRHGIGDDASAVAINQARFAAALGARPVWLNQVHGRRVVRLGPQDLEPGALTHEADASVSTLPGLACAVQVADCLPVLMSAGRAGVAAAHAGWRGLAAGVLEATLAALCDAARCAPQDVQCWLGPCIGPTQFEVGQDVVRAFQASAAPDDPVDRHFVPRGPDRPGKWLADLPALAAQRLKRAGVGEVGVSGLCTASDRSRFFSFRRDGQTGRLAAAIAIAPRAAVLSADG